MSENTFHGKKKYQEKKEDIHEFSDRRIELAIHPNHPSKETIQLGPSFSEL